MRGGDGCGAGLGVRDRRVEDVPHARLRGGPDSGTVLRGSPAEVDGADQQNAVDAREGLDEGSRFVEVRADRHTALDVRGERLR